MASTCKPLKGSKTVTTRGWLAGKRRECISHAEETVVTAEPQLGQSSGSPSVVHRRSPENPRHLSGVGEVKTIILTILRRDLPLPLG